MFSRLLLSFSLSRWEDSSEIIYIVPYTFYTGFAGNIYVAHKCILILASAYPVLYLWSIL
ncbi:MAG TPA: hypothetical protein DDX85_06165 [Nitrospiraceae bacterium]|nr:hypothetical protein [Nitrospiraceae bacterium]